MPSSTSLYTVVLVIAVAGLSARVVHYERLNEPSLPRPWPAERPNPTPLQQSNDISRWCTVRALVDEGTFVIGQRTPDPTRPTGYRDHGIVFEEGWKTVDKVLHPERQIFYSTKPPLLVVLVAGEYWLLKHTLGWEITGPMGRWLVVGTILLTINVLPFAVYLWWLGKLLDRHVASDWGRLLVFTTAAFGTFLSTFAVSLNNHGPAAYAVFLAVAPGLLAAPQPGPPWSLPAALTRGGLMWAGGCAGCAAAFDLPATAFVAGLGGLLLLRQPLATFVWFVPAALVPWLVQSVLNYVAVGEWTPVYARFGTIWYEFAGSHWAPAPPGLVKKGIDFANDPKWLVLFHNLIGHHGIFSLSPIFIFSLLGITQALRQRVAWPHWAGFAALTLALTVILVGFYTIKQNNYGGWTSGPRWFFWLIPLWVLVLLPIADRLAASRVGRVLSVLALGFSVFAVVYPWYNPWRHPWIFDVLTHLKWIDY
jgi:hypothetical protein